MNKLHKPIGILGGTFDPIHNGHLQIAFDVKNTLDFQHIRFIPCKTPVHRQPTYANTKQRLAMLELALDNYPDFILDRRETERDTPSYTLTTLKTLKSDFPNSPLCLILGTDAFFSLPTWHHWHQLIEYCHFIVVTRTTPLIKKLPEIETFIQQYQTTNRMTLHDHLNGALYFHQITPRIISATNIRNQLQTNHLKKGLLPEKVFEYIQEHHLYV